MRASFGRWRRLTEDELTDISSPCVLVARGGNSMPCAPRSKKPFRPTTGQKLESLKNPNPNWKKSFAVWKKEERYLFTEIGHPMWVPDVPGGHSPTGRPQAAALQEVRGQKNIHPPTNEIVYITSNTMEPVQFDGLSYWRRSYARRHRPSKGGGVAILVLTFN